jgi:hypothetical protein
MRPASIMPLQGAPPNFVSTTPLVPWWQRGRFFLVSRLSQPPAFLPSVWENSHFTWSSFRGWVSCPCSPCHSLPLSAWSRGLLR